MAGLTRDDRLALRKLATEHLLGAKERVRCGRPRTR